MNVFLRRPYGDQQEDEKGQKQQEKSSKDVEQNFGEKARHKLKSSIYFFSKNINNASDDEEEEEEDAANNLHTLFMINLVFCELQDQYTYLR